MKRFLPIAAALFLMLALVGCGQHNETNELTGTTEQEESTYKLVGHSWDYLDFTSIEELVESHKTVREGKAVGDLAWKAEEANFKELDKLYAPAVIPEGCHLDKIRVLGDAVIFWYPLESQLGSFDADLNLFQDQNFSFYFCYQDTMDDILRQNIATKEDLIDGKYLFRKPNYLYWEQDGEVFGLGMPRSLLDKLPDKQKKIEEMIKYAEVKVVELGG